MKLIYYNFHPLTITNDKKKGIVLIVPIYTTYNTFALSVLSFHVNASYIHLVQYTIRFIVVPKKLPNIGIKPATGNTPTMCTFLNLILFHQSQKRKQNG